ncbi:prolactin-releasing peptide receptor [Ischnura elegans]|uniref:prolactin-releasing peptide receptor n=1 Tax=Ischnura elegans TaxID=197161 RepID=UPI001ED8BF5A|nr:prolactin-releasing peptide receptor [Ischnura elegans]
MAVSNRSVLLGASPMPPSDPKPVWAFPDFRSLGVNISGLDEPSEHILYTVTSELTLENASAALNVNVTDDTPPSEVDPEDIILNKAVQASFYVLYTTIFVLGIFGNALVCYVVGRNRAMQTVTNLFITNLALSDVLLCTLAVPFTPIYTFLGSWIFGKALCHLVTYAQGTSVYVSTLTLTSIAVDRFFVIIHPFRPRMRMCTCVAIIVGIWAFSLIVTFPYAFFMSQSSWNDRYYCNEHWPSESSRQVFGALTASMQFVIPFFVITYCYIRVSLRLNDRARCKPGNKTCGLVKKSSKREEMDRDRKRRTNRMLIAMVTIFGMSWLPINLLNLINDVYIPISVWKYYYFCFFCAHSLAMSSTCYNPILYAWLNENFRKEFKQVLPCFGSVTANCNAEVTGCGAIVRGARSGGGGGQSGGGPGGTVGAGGAGGGSARGGSGNWRRRSDRACNGNEVSAVQETLLPPSLASNNSQPGSRRCSLGAGNSSRGMQSAVTTATQVEESPEEELDGPLVQYSVEKDAVELCIKDISGRVEDEESEDEHGKNGVLLGPAVGNSRMGDLV